MSPISRRSFLRAGTSVLAVSAMPVVRAARTTWPTTKGEAGLAVQPTRLDVPPGDVTRYGARGDGVADDSQAVQRAFDAAALDGSVHFPAGKFRCLAIQVHGGTSISCDARARVIKHGGAPYSHVFECSSRLERSWDLARTAEQGADRIELRTVEGLATGTIVVIGEQRYAVEHYGRNQELNEVVGIAGTTAILRRPLVSSYADRAQLSSIAKPARAIKFEGMAIEIPDGVPGGGLYFDYGYECEVTDCVIEGPHDQAGICFWRSAWCTVTRGRVQGGRERERPGYGYGVAIANSSHNVIAREVHTVGVRENAMSLGSRLCRFEACVDEGAYDSSFNTHADGNVDCLVQGCSSVGSRGYGVVLGFEGSRAAEYRCVARNNRISDCGLEGIYCGADAERINQSPVIEGNSVVRPSGRISGRDGIRVVRARSPTVRDNRIELGGPVRAAIAIEQCGDAVVERNRVTGRAPGTLVLRDKSSSGKFDANTFE